MCTKYVWMKKKKRYIVNYIYVLHYMHLAVSQVFSEKL